MTLPPTTPGPDEPVGEPQPPAGAPQFAPPDGTGMPPLRPASPSDDPYGPPAGMIPPPPGAQPPQPAPVQYDPSQSYVVYQAAPPGGYGVPAIGYLAHDPMISADYAGWWQRSIAILRQAWAQLLVLQFVGFLAGLVVAIPEAIYGIGVLDDFVQQSNAAPGQAPDVSGLFGFVGLAMLSFVAAGLIGAMVTVAGNHIVVSAATGQPLRVGAAFGLAVRRCLPLLGWQVLAGIIMVAGFCACILPGIYLYAVFLVLPAVVTFERGGVAIGRCFQFFHRDLGSSVARVATIAGLLILVGVVSYVISEIIGALIGGTGQSATFGDGSTVVTTAAVSAVVVRSVVQGLFSAGVKTFTDVLVVTAYADMRARYEPLSTQTLAAEIGLAQETSPWT